MEDTVCGNKVTATPPAWEKWHAHAHRRKGAERGPRPLGQAQDFHAWPWQLPGATPSSSWDKYTRLWVRGHYPTGRLSLDPRSILKWIILWEQSGRLGRGSAAPWGNQIPPTLEDQLLGKEATLQNAMQMVLGPNEQQPTL